jgi:hypothetical protein
VGKVQSTNLRRKRVAVPQEEPLIESGREPGHPTMHEPAPQTVFVAEPPGDKPSATEKITQPSILSQGQ